MVNKKLRKRLLIDSLLANNIPNDKIIGKEKLVKAKLQEDGEFSWKIYRGLNDCYHRFIEYSNGLIKEYLVHKDNLKTDYTQSFFMRNAVINTHHIDSEIGKKEMEIITKLGLLDSLI